jgi:N-acetylmuramoyl-L-alanine amidase
VEILEQKTVGAMVWGRISNGWISMSYVVLDSNTTPAPETNNTAGQVGTIVNCSEWVRIRSGAGTNYAVAGYYYPGNQVTVTEQKNVGGTTWGKTADGWVSMYYVKLGATSGGNTGGDTNQNNGGSTATTQTGTIVNCTQWLRIRSGAGTSYAVAGYLKPNDKVTITEIKSVGATRWGKIESGWISMDYVRLDSAATNPPASTGNTKTITADCLRVRSAPGTSGSIVGYLYHGAKVEILATTNIKGVMWGQISNGWISMDYAK